MEVENNETFLCSSVQDYVDTMSVEYYVFEDLENATSVKIHKVSCYFVKRGPTKTTAWHGPYNLEKAKDVAEKVSSNYNKGWTYAKCCMNK
jgi:hypothetical protein